MCPSSYMNTLCSWKNEMSSELFISLVNSTRSHFHLVWVSIRIHLKDSIKIPKEEDEDERPERKRILHHDEDTVGPPPTDSINSNETSACVLEKTWNRDLLSNSSLIIIILLLTTHHVRTSKKDKNKKNLENRVHAHQINTSSMYLTVPLKAWPMTPSIKSAKQPRENRCRLIYFVFRLLPKTKTKTKKQRRKGTSLAHEMKTC